MDRDPELRPAGVPLEKNSPREQLHHFCSMPAAPVRSRRALAISEAIIEHGVLELVFFSTWLVLTLCEESCHYVKNFNTAAFDIFDAIGASINRATQRKDFPRLTILLGLTPMFICAPSMTVLILMSLVACMQNAQIKELEAQTELLKARSAGKAAWPIEEEWDVVGQMD